MSNIRTLSDLRSDSMRNADQGESSPLYYGSRSNSNAGANSNYTPPRSAPIRFMELLFPYYSWKSVILVVSIVQWAVYIATLVVGSEFPLVPSNDTLYRFGANFPPDVVKGQVWRLICPIFLHANFLHIFFNVFFQLRMAFAMERRYGLLLFTVVYFVSGFYGNLFSATTLFCGLKVGASTSGFGLIGLQISELILSWHLLQHRDRAVFNILMFVVMMLLFTFTFNGGRIDQMGHLGGCISGVCLGVLYNHQMENKPSWYKQGATLCVAILMALFLICVPVLFLVPRSCPV